ncbi:MAG: carbohydrate kinase [Spirochaetes bacterium GWF1_51_8]|nr:MAG: carbohydrate kinase [Spirochaetes bacterium GWF1_51_8]
MSAKEFDAVVIGAAGIDTNIYLYSNEVDFNVEVNFSRNRDYIGCAGGYSARLFNTLGKSTAFIGTIGDDFQGHYIREEMARDGIDLEGLFFDPEGTIRSVNFMYKDGRRKNFYDGKGAMGIRPDLAKCASIMKGAKVAHFSIVNWARYLLPVSREAGNIIACDIQDISDPNDEYRRDFVRAADVLFFSSVNFADPSRLIDQFLEDNPERIVICGRGKDGCALGTKNGIEFFPPVEMEKPVTDTNGAGDSLAVGFLTARYLDGYPLEESILRAQITARYTCTIEASTSAFITPSLLEKYYSGMKHR